MQAIVERAAGLDVHQASVVACVLIGRPGERPRQELRHFGTMTAVSLPRWRGRGRKVGHAALAICA
jgi:hypothetical protein